MLDPRDERDKNARRPHRYHRRARVCRQGTNGNRRWTTKAPTKEELLILQADSIELGSDPQ